MKIIYVFDALCGWCYGFSPTMQSFYERHAAKVEFEVISGGMITGPRIGPIGQVAPYIKKAYRDVERATGITFGEAFLNNVLDEGSTVFSSIPPAIALSIFKEELPKRAVEFSATLLKAIYYDGLAPEEISEYAELVEGYGLDGQNFIRKMQLPKYRLKANTDFERARALGVNGFPTVVVEREGTYTAIARGYVAPEDLESRYTKMIN